MLEALAKVGALNAFGHPAQVLLGPRRRDRRGPGDAARPDHRPDLAVRPGRGRRRGLRAPAAERDRGAGPRAPALGEGAAGAVPVRAPDGRGRRAGRPVRQRLFERPARRVARRSAGRHRRDRDRRPDGHHEGQGVDGDRDDGGPPGHRRGRRLPAAVRADRADLARRARSCWSPGGSTTRARRSRCWPTSSSSGTRRPPPARTPSPGRWPPATGTVLVDIRCMRAAGRLYERRASGPGRRDAAAPRARRPGPARWPCGGARHGARRPVRFAASGIERGRRRSTSRRSPRPSRSVPTSTRPVASRWRTSTTTSRPCRTKHARESWPTPPPTLRSTPGPGPVLHVRFAGTAPAGPGRRRHGDIQGRDARSTGRDAGGHPPAGAGWGSGAADGAAPRRRLRRRAAGGGPPPVRRRTRGAPPQLSRPSGTPDRPLGGQPAPVTRRICWTADSCSWYSARIALSVASSMSSSRAIWLTTAVSSAEIVPFAAPTAKQARRTSRRCSGSGQRLELAGDDVVLGPADGPGLELGHLGHEDGGRLIQPVVRLELALDRRRLLVADVEIGVRCTSQGVGGRRDQPGALRRHGIQPGDDPANGRGVAGRVGRNLVATGGFGGRRCGRAEEAAKHGASLSQRRRRRAMSRPFAWSGVVPEPGLEPGHPCGNGV